MGSRLKASLTGQNVTVLVTPCRRHDFSAYPGLSAAGAKLSRSGALARIHGAKHRSCQAALADHATAFANRRSQRGTLKRTIKRYSHR